MVKSIGKLLLSTIIIMFLIYGIKKVSINYNIPVLSTVSKEV